MAYSLPACAAGDNGFGHSSGSQNSLQSAAIPDFGGAQEATPVVKQADMAAAPMIVQPAPAPVLAYDKQSVVVALLALPAAKSSASGLPKSFQPAAAISAQNPLPLPAVKTARASSLDNVQVASADKPSALVMTDGGIQVASAESTPAMVAAQETAPDVDKSAYGVFNPVPDAAMRAFTPDRPAKATSPYTVDAGHFQIESDLANWTYDHNSQTNVNTSLWVTADPTLKLGITNNTDLELTFTSLVDIATTDKTAGTSQSVAGIGDLVARAKINVLGNDSGDYALAVVPYVKLPVASKNIGNGYLEGGVAVPLSVTLPDDWMLTYMGELDVLENAATDGVHAGVQNIVNLSHPITKTVTGAVELADNITFDRIQSNQVTLDLGLAWMVDDNLQLDAGVNAGMTRDAPDLQVYLGISTRF